MQLQSNAFCPQNSTPLNVRFHLQVKGADTKLSAARCMLRTSFFSASASRSGLSTLPCRFRLPRTIPIVKPIALQSKFLPGSSSRDSSLILRGQTRQHTGVSALHWHLAMPKTKLKVAVAAEQSRPAGPAIANGEEPRCFRL